MKTNKEEDIISSWHSNASNWIDVIEKNSIESRKLVTNKAILEAICHIKPHSVLDIGCGQGWLAKELAERGISITGVDVVPNLVERAREITPGNFFVASYEDIYEQRISFPRVFDAIVINFALIGKESTEKLLAFLPVLLTAKGTLFIQTLHPYSRKALNDYASGWKTGSWDGLGNHFTHSYEWYFRTLEDWVQLLKDSGFKRVNANNTFHPTTGSPLSVIFESQ